MNASNSLSAEVLKSYFEYNPETGIFTVLKKTSKKTIIGNSAGTKNDQGYLIIGFGYKRYRAHRLAWFYMTGEWPLEDIDHINGKRDDNRWSNLRSVSRHDNLKNASMRYDNSSGVTGITWDSKNQSWRAKAQVNGKTKHVGRFKSLEIAEKEIRKYRIANGFHENHGKNPNE